MSEQEITLDKSIDHSYQVHSLKVYKEPALPTDAVNLLYAGEGLPLKPFYCVMVVGNQTEDDNFPGYRVDTTWSPNAGDYPNGFPVADWECAMVGFKNTDDNDTYVAWPNVGVDGKWYVYYRRTGHDSEDQLNMLMVRRQFIFT